MKEVQYSHSRHSHFVYIESRISVLFILHLSKCEDSQKHQILHVREQAIKVYSLSSALIQNSEAPLNFKILYWINKRMTIKLSHAN